VRYNTKGQTEVMASKRGVRNGWTAVAVLILLFAVGCGGGGGGEGEGGKDAAETAQDTAVPVESALSKRDEIVASYTGTASLEPEGQAQVVAKTSGVVQNVLVEEGDKVRAGQVLATLDPERPRLAMRQSEASLKRLENDARRAEEMFKRKLLSAEASDRAKFDMQSQRAAYEMARLELSYTQVAAPISGTVSMRMIKPGNFMTINQSAFMIDDFDPLLAVLNVPERELRLLKPAMKVAMHVDALPGRTFEGVIARVSPVVDSKTGTLRVTAEFHDETGTLKSGMFGRLTVVYDTKSDALVVPREALADEDGETFVYVVEKDPTPPKPKKAEKKSRFSFGTAQAEEPKKPKKPAGPALVAKRKLVKLGYVSGDKVEILSGVAEGARVVTVGRSAVRDGTRVQVIESVK